MSMRIEETFIYIEFWFSANKGNTTIVIRKGIVGHKRYIATMCLCFLSNSIL